MAAFPAGLDTHIGQEQFDYSDHDQQHRSVLEIFILHDLYVIAAGKHSHRQHASYQAQDQTAQHCVQYVQISGFQPGKECRGALVKKVVQIPCQYPCRQQDDQQQLVNTADRSALQMGNGNTASQHRVQHYIYRKTADAGSNPCCHLFRPGPADPFVIHNFIRGQKKICHHIFKNIQPGHIRIIFQGYVHLISGHSELIFCPAAKSQKDSYQSRLRSYGSAEKKRQKRGEYNNRYFPVRVSSFIFKPDHRFFHRFRISAAYLMKNPDDQPSHQAHDDRIIFKRNRIRDNIPYNSDPYI